MIEIFILGLVFLNIYRVNFGIKFFNKSSELFEKYEIE